MKVKTNHLMPKIAKFPYNISTNNARSIWHFILLEGQGYLKVNWSNYSLPETLSPLHDVKQTKTQFRFTHIHAVLYYYYQHSLWTWSPRSIEGYLKKCLYFCIQKNKNRISLIYWMNRNILGILDEISYHLCPITKVVVSRSFEGFSCNILLSIVVCVHKINKISPLRANACNI